MKGGILMTLVVIVALSQMACSQNKQDKNKKEVSNMDTEMKDKVVKTEEEWKAELTPEQYNVLRENGTERAFTGELEKNKEDGMYYCAGCHAELFSSETKFESGSGWPSFFKPANEVNVKEIIDKSFGMVRTEVECNRCGGHLGHVFNDGPKPTGQRYCINSASLEFEKKDH